MTCTLDHSDPAGVPEFLCRACHPDTATERRRLEREIREVETAIANASGARLPMLEARLQELQLAELCL